MTKIQFILFFFFYLYYLVPDKASNALRRFIEALFITHTQTKLNTLGHLDDDEDSTIHRQLTDELCYDKLVRPMT